MSSDIQSVLLDCFEVEVRRMIDDELMLIVKVPGFGESCYALNEGLSSTDDECRYTTWLHTVATYVEIATTHRCIPTDQFEKLVDEIKLRIDTCIGALVKQYAYPHNFKN